MNTKRYWRLLALIIMIMIAVIIPFPIPIQRTQKDELPKYLIEQIDSKKEEEENEEQDYLM